MILNITFCCQILNDYVQAKNIRLLFIYFESATMRETSSPEVLRQCQQMAVLN